MPSSSVLGWFSTKVSGLRMSLVWRPCGCLQIKGLGFGMILLWCPCGCLQVQFWDGSLEAPFWLPPDQRLQVLGTFSCGGCLQMRSLSFGMILLWRPCGCLQVQFGVILLWRPCGCLHIKRCRFGMILVWRPCGCLQIKGLVFGMILVWRPCGCLQIKGLSSGMIHWFSCGVHVLAFKFSFGVNILLGPCGFHIKSFRFGMILMWRPWGCLQVSVLAWFGSRWRFWVQVWNDSRVVPVWLPSGLSFGVDLLWRPCARLQMLFQFWGIELTVSSSLVAASLA